MRVTPTPITAAFAGTFSGLTWPLLWPIFQGTDASSTLWLVLATIVLVALPAHALVLGFDRGPAANVKGVDVAMLSRIGAWLVAAIIAALLVAAWRATS